MPYAKYAFPSSFKDTMRPPEPLPPRPSRPVVPVSRSVPISNNVVLAVSTYPSPTPPLPLEEDSVAPPGLKDAIQPSEPLPHSPRPLNRSRFSVCIISIPPMPSITRHSPWVRCEVLHSLQRRRSLPISLLLVGWAGGGGFGILVRFPRLLSCFE